MRIGVMGCYHETNTFAPGLTTIDDFKAEWIVGRAAFQDAYRGTRTSMGGVIDAAERLRCDCEPLFYTQALPSGTVSDEAVDAILAEMVSHVTREGDRLDGLIVILHGAMASESCQDVEGKLLGAIRGLFVHKPIVVTVDLHANISEAMVENCDVMVGYDTYPHVDVYDRAVEACELLARCIKREIRPTAAFARTNLLVAPTRLDTQTEPMQSLMNLAFAHERDDDVLVVTVAGGFAFADVFCAGASIVVTTDGNPLRAQEVADQLADWMYVHKAEFRPALLKLGNLHQAFAANSGRPVVLIESSDNVGAGSPGDATHVLRHLVENRVRRFLCVIADPDSCAVALSGGVGVRVALSVGGKTDKKYGRQAVHGLPVELSGRVRLISDGSFRHKGPYMTGMKANMGKTAVLELEEIDSAVVLTERRVAPWDVNHVRSVGVDPQEYDVIVAKAAVAWRSSFENLAKWAVEIDTPGASNANLLHFSYLHLPEAVEVVGGDIL